MTKDVPVPALRPVETIPVQENGQSYIVLRDPLGYSEKMIAIASEAVPILNMFDGLKTLDDIAGEIEQITGEPVKIDQLDAIVSVLEEAKLLQSAEFSEYRLRVEQEFRESTIRPSTLAGGGYPDDAQELEVFLDSLMASPQPEDFEPGKSKSGKRLRGLMVPHIDFNRGGASYGRAYREWNRLLPPPEAGPLLVGVIGVAHQGALSPIVLTEKDFVTPLGALSCDHEAIRILRDRLGDRPFDEEWVHRHEHSIELQVVWLQHLLADRDVTFLPILAGILDEGDEGTPGNVEPVERAIEALLEVEKLHDGPVLWIASVDFAHVGPQFGETDPVGHEMSSTVERRDMEAIETVRSVDADGWWLSLMEDDNARRVCGQNATYLALRLLRGARGVILDYEQALAPDRTQMVSFASALFQDR